MLLTAVEFAKCMSRCVNTGCEGAGNEARTLSVRGLRRAIMSRCFEASNQGSFGKK